MREKIIGKYKITNKISGKSYIGQSIAVEYNGMKFESKTELAKYLGISRSLLKYRIKKGIIEVIV